MGKGLRRLYLQAELFRYRRKLHKAETELGLLGWQQVDFLGTEVQAQVEKIQSFEKEQASLVNVSAELAAKLRDIHAQRERGRRARAASQEKITAEREPILQRLDELEKRWREAQETQRRFRLALAELENLPATLARHYASLQAISPQTAQTRADLEQTAREKERVTAELVSLEEGHACVAEEIRRLDVALAEERAALAANQDAERQMREKYATVDRELALKARECTRGTHLSERKITALDEEMIEPLRLVGKCLADHEIAPMNQPEALSTVEELRAKIAAWENELAEL